MRDKNDISISVINLSVFPPIYIQNSEQGSVSLKGLIVEHVSPENLNVYVLLLCI